MNVAVLAILFAFAKFLALLPTSFVWGVGIGYFWFFCGFRWHYGWWPDFNMGGEDDQNSRLPRISPDRVDFR